MEKKYTLEIIIQNGNDLWLGIYTYKYSIYSPLFECFSLIK